MKILKTSLSVALSGAFLSASALAQPNAAPTTIGNPPNLTGLPVQPGIIGLPAQAAQPAAPRPGTPQEQIEFDLRRLLNTLNTFSKDSLSYDFEVPAAISGARIGYFGLSEWKDYFLQQRGITRYRLDRIEVENLEKDAARVKVFYSLLTPNNALPVDGKPAEPAIFTSEENETLDLKREMVPWFGDKGEKWRIVPRDFQNLRPYPVLLLENVAYYGSQRAGTLPQLRAQITQSRLKGCALGALQFTQDYDEYFRFGNEFWREAIRPYVPNDAIFGIPGTSTQYTFNDNLSDKSLAALNEPAQTVLFYEGEDEKPIFRYQGRAAICFADGHVKMVSPEEAKTLIWRP